MNKLTLLILIFCLSACGDDLNKSDTRADPNQTTNKQKKLADAIQKGDNNEINNIIKSGVDLDKEIDKKLPLELAAQQDATIFMNLVNKGAQISKAPKRILLAAVDAQNTSIVKILLGKIDINKDKIGEDALAASKNSEIITLIKDALKKTPENQENEDLSQISDEYEKEKAIEELRHKLALERIKAQRKDIIDAFDKKLQDLQKGINNLQINLANTKYKNWHRVTSLPLKLHDLGFDYIILVDNKNNVAVIQEATISGKFQGSVKVDSSEIIGDISKPNPDYRTVSNWRLELGRNDGKIVKFK